VAVLLFSLLKVLLPVDSDVRDQ